MFVSDKEFNQLVDEVRRLREEVSSLRSLISERTTIYALQTDCDHHYTPHPLAGVVELILVHLGLKPYKVVAIPDHTILVEDKKDDKRAT